MEFGRKKEQRKTFYKSLLSDLSGKRSIVLLEIDFDAEYQDYIVSAVRKLSDGMYQRNIVLSNAKESLCGGKIDDKQAF